MASGKVHGRTAVFTQQDSGGTARDFSGDLNSVEFDQATAMAKSTGIGGSTDETYLIGFRDNKFSLKAFFNDTALTGIYTVLSGISLAFKQAVYSPAGTTTGNVKITAANACVTDFKITSPVGGTVTLDANEQVSGGVVFSTN